MQIAQGVHMLKLQIDSFGGHQELNPTLIWDSDYTVLIDTGTPGQLESIQIAMNNAGVSFDQLNVIILTHQDIDHIGSLPEILHASSSPIEVYAHIIEKPYIEGEIPLLKANLDSMVWQLESIPLKDRQEIVNQVQHAAKSRVSQTLVGGELLPFCGRIQVIHTPGHTPGHISLYLKKSKTLVAGDSMYSVAGMLQGPHTPSTPDMDIALHSIVSYINLDIENVICYHGGLSQANLQQQLNCIVNKK